jgi:catechol 2,3-dioxygenase-like lactoylglutathione lyase family enzyme
MFLDVIPKLPMRNKVKTKSYYLDLLGFEEVGDYGNYLLVKRDGIEIHFFEFIGLNPYENDGQVYIRLNEIEQFYKELQANNVPIHPNGHLENKPWGQQEFSLLDPDHNLLTFGQQLDVPI